MTLVWGVQPATGQIVTLDPQSGAIVSSFTAPDGLTADHTQTGLTMAELGGSLLYVNSDVDPTALYRLNPTSGEVLAKETVSSGAHDGLAFDSGAIFYGRNGVDVRRQQGFSGTISDGWASGAVTGALAGDDYDRLFGFFGDGMIHELSSFDHDSEFLSTIVSPASDVEGLAFDSMWLYASTASGQLYTLDPSEPSDATVLNEVTVPGGALHGLAALTEKTAAENGRDIDPTVPSVLQADAVPLIGAGSAWKYRLFSQVVQRDESFTDL